MRSAYGWFIYRLVQEQNDYSRAVMEERQNPSPASSLTKIDEVNALSYPTGKRAILTLLFLEAKKEADSIGLLGAYAPLLQNALTFHERFIEACKDESTSGFEDARKAVGVLKNFLELLEAKLLKTKQTLRKVARHGPKHLRRQKSKRPNLIQKCRTIP